MKTSSTADVTIIGAGIIGLCTAYQLARRASLKILVLEKGQGLGEGSTGASSAVLRHRYSFDQMVYLARDGINAYRSWSEFTGLLEPRAVFQPDGVLWMPGDDANWADSEHARLAALGISTCVLSDTDLNERFPALNPCVHMPDTITGEEHRCQGGSRHLLELGGGYFDPVSALEDLAEACRREGVLLQFNREVTEIRSSSGQVSGVKLAGGEGVATGVVINASGPWCNSLISQTGITWPWRLVPTRVQVLYLDRPEAVLGNLPVTVDVPGGLYFRLQNRGQQVVVGSTLEKDEREVVDEVDQFNRFVDEPFQQAKLHALHHRIPSWPYRGQVRGYCGLYTVNRIDMHPVVGETELKGFWAANGFSGHGFKLAPAIGSLLARQLTGEKGSFSRKFESEIDPAFLAVNRNPLHLARMNVLA